MRTNERVRALRNYLYNEEEHSHASSPFHDLVGLFAKATNVKLAPTHGTWQTKVIMGHPTADITFRSLPSTQHLSYQIPNPKEKLEGETSRVRTLVATFKPHAEPTAKKVQLNIRLPLDYRPKPHLGSTHYASDVEFSVFTHENGAPSLTVAKLLGEKGKPSKLILTSHTPEGHTLGTRLATQLPKIAARFKGEGEPKFLASNIEYVKGEGFKLQVNEPKPTRIKRLGK